MRKYVLAAVAAVMAASALATGATAAPFALAPFVPKSATSSDVVQVRDFDNNREWFRRGGDSRRYEGGFNRRDRNWDRRGNWDHRDWRRYRHHDRDNGFLYPGAAFLGGVVVGNLIGRSDNVDDGYYVRHHRRLGSAHVQWCYNRYRSYRAYDNSFQPYHGPRQQCYSPYS